MLMLSPFYNRCNVKICEKAAAGLNDHPENAHTRSLAIALQTIQKIAYTMLPAVFDW